MYYKIIQDLLYDKKLKIQKVSRDCPTILWPGRQADEIQLNFKILKIVQFHAS